MIDRTGKRRGRWRVRTQRVRGADAAAVASVGPERRVTFRQLLVIGPALCGWVGCLFVYAAFLWDAARLYTIPLAVLAFLPTVPLTYDLFTQLGLILLSRLGWYDRRVRPRRRSERGYAPLPEKPRIAVVYCTADDFDASAVESLLRLSYPKRDIFVFDNGSDELYSRRVAQFVESHDVTLIRRLDPSGGKAGNLNHGLAKILHRYPLYAVFDADSQAAPDFLERALAVFGDDHVAFAQGRLLARPDDGLARYIAGTTHMIYDGVMPAQQALGLAMCHGHGVLVRSEAWREIGGYPTSGAEDVGLTLKVRMLGRYGCYVEDALCSDRQPRSILQYAKQMEKWVRSCTNTFLVHGGAFMRSPLVDPCEKVDALRIILQLATPSLALLMSLLLSAFSALHADVSRSLMSGWSIAPIVAVLMNNLLSPTLVLWRQPRVLVRTVVWSAMLHFGISLRNLVDFASVLISRTPVFSSTGNPQELGYSEGIQLRQSWWARPKAADEMLALACIGMGLFFLVLGLDRGVVWLVSLGISVLTVEALHRHFSPALGWLGATISISMVTICMVDIVVTRLFY